MYKGLRRVTAVAVNYFIEEVVAMGGNWKLPYD